METRAHQNLKRLAVAFLRRHGCRAVATEVRCPIARYRVDVAGFIDPAPRRARAGVAVPAPEQAAEPRTVMIECKQSREDFLRHRRDLQRLIAHRDDLERIRRSIESKSITVHEPHLRRGGTSLFREMEEWDYTASRSAGYRKVMRKLRRLDLQIHGDTKFCMIARYRLADRLYIAAPRGLIRPRELPAGWGLLDIEPKWLEEASVNNDLFGECALEPVIRGPRFSSKPTFRTRLLRNIAVSASYAAMPGL